MSWKIDRDYLADAPEQSDVGRGQYDEGAPAPMSYRFRLLDDDGEVYYGGRYDAAALDDDEAYGGLYQALKWGASNAGCADLQVKTPAGEWESIYG